jgi:hypothetical protein
MQWNSLFVLFEKNVEKSFSVIFLQWFLDICDHLRIV